MLTLFYSPGACSFAAHAVLEFLGQPYQAIKVTLSTHQTEENKNYYDINPAGSVPALLLNENTVLTQNTAILIYLGELDKTHQLLPKAGTLERYRCHEWLGLISADLHKPFGALFHPEAFVDTNEAKAQLQLHTKKNIINVLTLIEKKLSAHSHDFVLGNDFSIIDIYLFVFYRWLKHFKFDLQNICPRFLGLGEKVETLEIIQTTLHKEGLRS